MSPENFYTKNWSDFVSMPIHEILTIPPFSLSYNEKEKFLTEVLSDLTRRHYDNCKEYNKILNSLHYDVHSQHSYVNIPFIPVRLFKEHELFSIPREDIFKTMTSSGTTGQRVSKIFLDKESVSNQQKTLIKIVSEFTGSIRLPMIIIDSPSVIKDRAMFSARGAGILGFSIFGTDRIYALDEEMNLNFDAIKFFLHKHQGKPILLFGFTFMIWQFFYQALRKHSLKLDLSNGILIHGGGWKKLIHESVSKEDFKHLLNSECGLANIHDYYGMVEQTGSVYMECQYGHLHASIYSDIIVRNVEDFSECPVGKKGIIQVMSVLPRSYPGHSLLTEDEGVVLGIDDCKCGRKGKYFHIVGRINGSEIRGCSDTYRG